jgi:hypothetical protein
MAALRSAAVAQNDETPPTPLIALATFVRSRADGAGPQRDVVAVPSASGWITLHASLPEGRASGQVAIVLERAAGPEATTVRLEAHGVTAREREIATLLAPGSLQRRDRRNSRPLALHRPRPHQEPLREDSGELAARARRACFPRPVPATTRPTRTIDIQRAVRRTRAHNALTASRRSRARGSRILHVPGLAVARAKSFVEPRA